MTAQLIFDEVHRSRHQLVLNYRVDDIAFSTTYWYDTVDFHLLEERFGREFMRKVYFHLLAFEANKAASLKPAVLDLGPYRDLYTEHFFHLWSTIFHHVWGVWRYANRIRDYEGPEVLAGNGRPLAHARLSAAGERGGTQMTLTNADLRRLSERSKERSARIRVHPRHPRSFPSAVSERVLSLCGGGKDSLAAAKLLERGGIPFDVMVYSHNIYGKAQPQHDLIDGMLAHTAAGRVHRAWVYDNALDSPAARLYPEYGVTHLLAAETVSSYWTALPIALQHDYTRVALGVTKSTDEHNLIWEETGEQINYLWGMSTEAENLLHDYIQAEIAENLSFFHLLRPIYDITVFNLLAQDTDAVPSTHSCAQQKPWCCRCPKCIYVWMHLAAYLDDAVVRQMFDRNLFDMPENRGYLRKMLALEGYKPWDCMGTVSETQVAYLLCRAKGWSGQAVADIQPGEIAPDIEAFLASYAQVEPLRGAIPPDLYERLRPQMLAGAERARAYVRAYLADGLPLGA